eukprot:3113114-Pleurochrysis_carterae.AAC.2
MGVLASQLSICHILPSSRKGAVKTKDNGFAKDHCELACDHVEAETAPIAPFKLRRSTDTSLIKTSSASMRSFECEAEVMSNVKLNKSRKHNLLRG